MQFAAICRFIGNLPFSRQSANVRLLPRCTVGSRQAEHESQGESMEEDDMVKSRYGNTLSTERDEPIRREGLQAQGSL